MNKKFNLSPLFCAYNKVIILKMTDEKILIGIVKYDDEELKNRILKVYDTYHQNQKIDFKKISEIKFSSLLPKVFTKEITEGKLNNTLPFYETENKSKEEHALLEENFAAQEEPIVNLLNSIIIDAFNLRATDIHIENTSVRLRINGYLKKLMDIPQEYVLPLVMRIKVLSKLNLSESRYAQDGRFSFYYDEKNIDIRVSIIPIYSGESIVLRLLNRKFQNLEFTELGFNIQQEKQIHKMLKLRQNLILVCGPTGAGKSTTVASMMNVLRKNGLKIISLEDPVEYKLLGVTQIPIRPEINLDFKDIVTKIYRQDPDVLVIGEIRDEVTAKVAVSFASTGHLVIATLHTSNYKNAILRMLDLGVSKFLLYSILNSVIIQHLDLNFGKERKLNAQIIECNTAVLEEIA